MPLFTSFSHNHSRRTSSVSYTLFSSDLVLFYFILSSCVSSSIATAGGTSSSLSSAPAGSTTNVVLDELLDVDTDTRRNMKFWNRDKLRQAKPMPLLPRPPPLTLAESVDDDDGEIKDDKNETDDAAKNGNLSVNNSRLISPKHSDNNNIIAGAGKKKNRDRTRPNDNLFSPFTSTTSSTSNNNDGDDKVFTPDVSVFPYNAMGKMFFEAVDGTLNTCTAQFTDSGDVVTTAAHCVYDNILGGYTKNRVLLTQYRDGDYKAYYGIGACIVPQRWKTGGRNPDQGYPFDVAVCKISDDRQHPVYLKGDYKGAASARNDRNKKQTVGGLVFLSSFFSQDSSKTHPDDVMQDDEGVAVTSAGYGADFSVEIMHAVKRPVMLTQSQWTMRAALGSGSSGGAWMVVDPNAAAAAVVTTTSTSPPPTVVVNDTSSPSSPTPPTPLLGVNSRRRAEALALTARVIGVTSNRVVGQSVSRAATFNGMVENMVRDASGLPTVESEELVALVEHRSLVFFWVNLLLSIPAITVAFLLVLGRYAVATLFVSDSSSSPSSSSASSSSRSNTKPYVWTVLLLFFLGSNLADTATRFHIAFVTARDTTSLGSIWGETRFDFGGGDAHHIDPPGTPCELSFQYGILFNTMVMLSLVALALYAIYFHYAVRPQLWLQFVDRQRQRQSKRQRSSKLKSNNSSSATTKTKNKEEKNVNKNNSTSNMMRANHDGVQGQGEMRGEEQQKQRQGVMAGTTTTTPATKTPPGTTTADAPDSFPSSSSTSPSSSSPSYPTPRKPGLPSTFLCFIIGTVIVTGSLYLSFHVARVWTPAIASNAMPWCWHAQEGQEGDGDVGEGGNSFFVSESDFSPPPNPSSSSMPPSSSSSLDDNHLFRLWITSYLGESLLVCVLLVAVFLPAPKVKIGPTGTSTSTSTSSSASSKSSHSSSSSSSSSLSPNVNPSATNGGGGGGVVDNNMAKSTATTETKAADTTSTSTTTTKDTHIDDDNTGGSLGTKDKRVKVISLTGRNVVPIWIYAVCMWFLVLRAAEYYVFQVLGARELIGQVGTLTTDLPAVIGGGTGGGGNSGGVSSLALVVAFALKGFMSVVLFCCGTSSSSTSSSSTTEAHAADKTVSQRKPQQKNSTKKQKQERRRREHRHHHGDNPLVSPPTEGVFQSVPPDLTIHGAIHLEGRLGGNDHGDGYGDGLGDNERTRSNTDGRFNTVSAAHRLAATMSATISRISARLRPGGPRVFSPVTGEVVSRRQVLQELAHLADLGVDSQPPQLPLPSSDPMSEETSSHSPTTDVIDPVIGDEEADDEVASHLPPSFVVNVLGQTQSTNNNNSSEDDDISGNDSDEREGNDYGGNIRNKNNRKSNDNNLDLTGGTGSFFDSGGNGGGNMGGTPVPTNPNPPAIVTGIVVTRSMVRREQEELRQQRKFDNAMSAYRA